MSVPRSLDIPDGVQVTRIATERAVHAVHRCDAVDRRGSLLLIPGWTGSKEDFTPILPLLAEAGFDVVAYDQRGQFETAGRPDDDYSLEGFAEDAAALMTTAFESAEPVHVLGHSFGGLVAQTLVTLHPDRVASLSLVCTGPGALGDSPQRPLQRMSAALGKLPLLQLHEMREQGIRRPAQITAFLAKRFTSNSAASLRAMTQHLIEAPDIVDDVAQSGAPVIVIRGADDDAWPFDRQDEMAQRLGTAVVVIPDSAHSPAVENPEALVKVLIPFFNEHS